MLRNNAVFELHVFERKGGNIEKVTKKLNIFYVKLLT